MTRRLIVTSNKPDTQVRVVPRRTMSVSLRTFVRPFFTRPGMARVGGRASSLGVRRLRVEVAEISMAWSTMQTEHQATALSKGHRGWRLIAGVVFASALLVIPILVAGPDRQPMALLIAEG